MVNVKERTEIISHADSEDEAIELSQNGSPVTIFSGGIQAADALRVAEKLGEVKLSAAFEKVRDIKITGTSRSIAESAGDHDLHTDGTFDNNPPRKFLLQVVNSDLAGGGVSLFMPVAPLLESLRDDHYRKLNSVSVQFKRVDDVQAVKSTNTMIYARGDGRIGFRWRDDRFVNPTTAFPDVEFEAALESIRDYIRRTKLRHYRAREGEMILVDNDAVLHGRTALSAESSRLIRRVWIQ